MVNFNVAFLRNFGNFDILDFLQFLVYIILNCCGFAFSIFHLFMRHLSNHVGAWSVQRRLSIVEE
jgi:hypothetical protein